MKAKIFILMMALALSGALKAQGSLKAVIDQCVDRKDMDVEVLYSKNPKTKKPESKMIKIMYSQKEYPKLTDQFHQAFNKEQEAAYRVVENRRSGKRICRFSNGTTDISVSMERTTRIANGIQVIYIERYDVDYD